MSIPTITDIIIGKDVVVNNISTLGSIELQHSVEASPIWDSSTSAGADRLEGNIDFRGAIRAWGHTPPLFPNSTFALGFSISASGGGKSASQVMCTGLDIIVPVNDPSTQNGIYYTALFGACGEDLAAGSGSDAGSVEKPNAKGLNCTFAGAEQTGIELMRLSMRSMTRRHVDSQTDGVYFRPVSNIDWTFRYRRRINSLALLPAQNTVGTLVMEVAADKYWTLTYGRMVGAKGIYDHQSGKVIAAEVTIEMCTDEGTVGAIVNPSGVTKWPT